MQSGNRTESPSANAEGSSSTMTKARHSHNDEEERRCVESSGVIFHENLSANSHKGVRLASRRIRTSLDDGSLDVFPKRANAGTNGKMDF